MNAQTSAMKATIVAGLLGALIAVSHVFSSGLIGVCGLAVAVAACSARSLDVAVTAAGWGLALLMFGPAGAGCFILAQGFVSLSVAIAPRPQSLGAPLLATVAVAAVVAVSGAPLIELVLGAGGRTTAELVCIFAVGAPGLLLGRLASAAAGAERYEAIQVAALGPLFLAMVVAAKLGGLNGAASAVSVGWLATPLIVLLLAPAQYADLARGAFGVLAAGLVAAVAMGAVTATGNLPLTMIAGLLAGVTALRVHAPNVAQVIGARARASITHAFTARAPGGEALYRVKSGQPRSLSETKATGIGHSRPRPGSLKRTPRSAPGA
ncbi:MAG: hypothetical protein FD124_70 [Alphaproteobacteria bacterium]|nr:MAG: hypothetical protein FD160_872 [Caulobacteraceae bacterium]TPW08880.1 MAG: hypothetical protein FD124_70 [Alphaproteobacteria bacterium]